MADIATNPALQLKFVAENAKSTFAFLLEQENVPLRLQYEIVKSGYKDMRSVSLVDDDKAGVRTWLKDELQV